MDGLCHYKDLNYSEKESELQNYRKGQKVDFKLLEVDMEAEKIRLGIKFLENDPFDFFTNKSVNDVVTGVVKSSNQNGVYLELNKDLSILIKKNQLAKEVENQRSSRFVKGDKIDSVITELDLKKRKVQLSIKKLEEVQTAAAVKKYGSKDSGGVLGDILGKALNLKKKKK